MKIRVLFLKKSYFYYAAAILALVIILAVLLIKKNTTVDTFNEIVDNTIVKADLNGDGKEDILYVKQDGTKYFIQVTINDHPYYLEPSKTLNTLGSYTPYSPIKITLQDISRDKTPEIFTQGMENDKSIIHVFKWNRDKFEDIFCSSNNMLGFIDSSTNRTPRVMLGNFVPKGIELSTYLLLGSSELKSFSYNMPEYFMGKDTVAALINYLQSFPQGESNIPKSIFSDSITGKDLALFGKLAGESNSFIFSNGAFKDVSWNKEGEVQDIIYSLNFKMKSSANAGNFKPYTITIKLRPEGENGSYCYKIYQIK